MAGNEQLYQKLKAELEDLKQLADKQNHHYKSSRELLYEGLSKVYLWWQEASKDEKLLLKLYEEYNLQYKKQTKHEITFSPLLRYLWNMDGSIHSNKIDLWNRTLNAVHTAVQNNKGFYKTNTLQKLITFINTSGGAKTLAGYDSQQNTDNTVSKNKLTKTAEQKLNNAHLTNGKNFFANNSTALAKFKTKHTLANVDGFAIALVRANDSGYEVIGTLNDRNLVEQAVIAAYKRTSEQMPNTARLLTEIIRTQTLPSSIAKLATELAENSKYKGDKDKPMQQLKRVLYIAKEAKFVLSENRSTCSTVTIATPHTNIIQSEDDVALAVRDRTYIENNLIHSGDFNFYTADAAETVPATQNEAANFKLKLENTITKKFRFIRFYPLSTFQFPPSKSQTVLKPSAQFKPTYKVHLTADWLYEMNALFLARWVDGFGAKMKRAEHKLLRLALTKTFIAFSFNYKGKQFKENEVIDLAKDAKGSIDVQVLSKDIVPVLNALVNMEIAGDVLLEADDKMLRFSFATDCADYSINVPCCTLKAKRIDDYFDAYEVK
jgi:hypothetical protein